MARMRTVAGAWLLAGCVAGLMPGAPARADVPDAGVGTPGTGSIAGFVRYEDGTPAQGVHVHALPLKGLILKTLSGADGSYRFATMAPGKVQISISRDGSITVHNLAGNANHDKSGDGWRHMILAPGERKTGVDFAVPKGSNRISGTVFGLDGKPLAGVKIKATLQKAGSPSPWHTCGIGIGSQAEASSAPDGTFLFEELPSGRYMLSADDRARSAAALLQWVAAGTATAQLRMSRGAVLAGQILGQDGKLVDRYRLTIRYQSPGTDKGPSGSCVRTDNSWTMLSTGGRSTSTRQTTNGMFELWSLSAGTYELAFADGAGSTALLPALELAENEQKVGMKVLLQSQPSVPVRGRVVKANGSPIGDVSVNSGDAQGPVGGKTGPDGRFEIGGAKPGSSFMLRFHSGPLRAGRDVTVPAGVGSVDVGDVTLHGVGDEPRR